MSRVSWGKAKLEIYALKSEILALHKTGATVNSAYVQLVDRLTVGQSTFRRHAADIINAATGSQQRSSTPPVLPTPAPDVPVTLPITQSAAVTTTPPSSPKVAGASARPIRTVIPGSSLKKSGFNDPELRVATDELLDQLYGTANPNTDEKETNE